MHLMYQLDAEGKRVYTLTELAKEADLSAIAIVTCNTIVLTEQWLYPTFKSQKENSLGVPSISAHPARFSPDDKFSKERLTCKKRFNLLPTQQPPKEY